MFALITAWTSLLLICAVFTLRDKISYMVNLIQKSVHLLFLLCLLNLIADCIETN